MADRENISEALQLRTPHSALRTFLVGLVMLLAFASWWHLDVAHSFYPGTRWTGLWDNPNIYGMLMAAGVVLTAGLLLADRRWKMEDGRWGIWKKSEVRIQKSKSSEEGGNCFALFALFCGYQIRNPQSAIRNFIGCGGNDGRWVVFQLQPGRMVGNGLWFVILGQGAWKIQMAVCGARRGACGVGRFIDLGADAGRCAVVSQAHGFKPAIRATPGRGMESRLSNYAGSSVWRRLEQGG
jgi:hypothetical protein